MSVVHKHAPVAPMACEPEQPTSPTYKLRLAPWRHCRADGTWHQPQFYTETSSTNAGFPQLKQIFVRYLSPSRVWPHQVSHLSLISIACQGGEKGSSCTWELKRDPHPPATVATAWLQLLHQGSNSQAHHRQPQGSRRDSAPWETGSED